jgi:hypothetical protein
MKNDLLIENFKDVLSAIATRETYPEEAAAIIFRNYNNLLGKVYSKYGRNLKGSGMGKNISLKELRIIEWLDFFSFFFTYGEDFISIPFVIPIRVPYSYGSLEISDNQPNQLREGANKLLESFIKENYLDGRFSDEVSVEVIQGIFESWDDEYFLNFETMFEEKQDYSVEIERLSYEPELFPSGAEKESYYKFLFGRIKVPSKPGNLSEVMSFINTEKRGWKYSPVSKGLPVDCFEFKDSDKTKALVVEEPCFLAGGMIFMRASFMKTNLLAIKNTFFNVKKRDKCESPKAFQVVLYKATCDPRISTQKGVNIYKPTDYYAVVMSMFLTEEIIELGKIPLYQGISDFFSIERVFELLSKDIPNILLGKNRVGYIDEDGVFIPEDGVREYITPPSFVPVADTIN